MTLLLELREAARRATDELVKFNLKLAADELDRAIRALATHPTAEALAAVNGKWAYGVRLLGYATKHGTPGGTGAGMKEGAQLAAAA